MNTTIANAKKILNNKAFLYATLSIVVSFFIFSNIFFVGGAKYSFAQIAYVLKDPSHIPLSNITHGLTVDSYREISYGIWACVATIVASTGLAVSGLVVQSLTKNPLADASTLGFIQGGIFALLVALVIGWSAYYLKFIAVVIGIAISTALLVAIISFSRGRATNSKIILAGLAIGIVFKTFAFLVRKGDKFLNSVSYNYTMGGAETVNASIGNNQWQILLISSCLIIGSLLIFFVISRSLTLLELGDEKAKQLGVKVKLTKILSIVVVIISVPSAVLIVGNLAFIGLFSAHLSRYLFKTRNFTMLLLPSILIGITIASFGLFLTNFIPSVNSGIWMTIIGAPYLIYAGIRGVK